MRAIQLVGCAVALLLAGVAAGTAQELRPVTMATEGPEREVTALERPARLTVRGASLEDALVNLYTTSGVPVSFSPSSLPGSLRVSCDCRNVSVKEALDHLLQRTSLRYRELEGHVLVFDAARRPMLQQAQPTARYAGLGSLPVTASVIRPDVRAGTVSGRVQDATTQQPLAGVNVTVVGTQRGTITNAEGRFLLAGVTTGPQRIRASLIGYLAQEQAVVVVEGQSATVDFQLQSQAVHLEEVVAIGYGTQQRRDVTGSIASISADQLARAPIASVGAALQGRASGVQVTQNSSAPGGGFSMRIRGSGSLTSSNEPLYVIDGLPVSAQEAAPSSGIVGGQQRPSSLAFLNPEDIESIEILKDASATAIYGARGANGVVLITTKKGRVGRTSVEVESSYGMQQSAQRYDLLDAVQYAEYANEVYRLQGSSGVPFPDLTAVGVNTDWQGLILRSAPVMQHNLVLRGGSEDTRFALSGGYTDEQGIIRETGFQRYSFRGSIDHRVNSRLNVGSNVSANRTRTEAGNSSDGTGDEGSSAMQSALISWPFMPVYGEDGRYLYMDRDVPANLASLGWSAGQNYENPVGAINEVTDQFQDNRVLGNAFAEYALLSSLTLRLNGGVDVLNSSRNAYFTRFTRQGGSGRNGVAQSGAVDRSNYLAESILRFNTRLGELHGIQATSGFTFERSDLTSRSMTNQNFATDHLGYHGIATGAMQGGPRIGAGNSSSTLASFIGRLNYDFAGRYLFTVTGRYDGSSKLGVGNKWGFFPSAALGWRISDEEFAQGADWLSDLKLRVSYGVTGNQEIGTYQSLARMGTGATVLNQTRVNAYFPASIANPNLRWERSRMENVGLDFGFLGNRVSGVFDVYRRTTDDLLYRIPLPTELGFGSVLMNTGSIENRGVEFALNTVLVERPDFGWSLGGNISANRNKVLDIGGGLTQFFGSNLTSSGSFPNRGGNLVRVGEPLGLFFGYRVDGIFRNEAEIAAHCRQTPEGCVPIQPGALPGQPRYVDVDGDGRITAADRVILGNPEPAFTFGLTNDLRFGRLTVFSFVQGTYGNDVYNLMLNLLAPEHADLRGNLYAQRYLDRWTPDNPNGSWPRLSLPAGEGYRGPGDIRDMYIEDGSYLRLRTLSLGYDVPERLAQRVLGGAHNARLSVNAQNLFTLTRYSGINPDVNSRGGDNVNRGIDFGAYPLARSYSVGLRVGL